MPPSELVFEQPISFESQGATLRGYLITKADGQRRCPSVIMAHGTSATVQMVAIEYARTFARAGLAAIIYDHRGFGRSAGEPRLEINPWVQCRGYLDALSFAASLPKSMQTESRYGATATPAVKSSSLRLAIRDPRPSSLNARYLEPAYPNYNPVTTGWR